MAEFSLQAGAANLQLPINHNLVANTGAHRDELEAAVVVDITISGGGQIVQNPNARAAQEFLDGSAQIEWSLQALTVNGWAGKDPPLCRYGPSIADAHGFDFIPVVANSLIDAIQKQPADFIGSIAVVERGRALLAAFDWNPIGILGIPETCAANIENYIHTYPLLPGCFGS